MPLRPPHRSAWCLAVGAVWGWGGATVWAEVIAEYEPGVLPPRAAVVPRYPPGHEPSVIGPPQALLVSRPNNPCDLES